MGSLQNYKKELDYSYAPGIFPAMEAILKRPEECLRLLVHSKSEGSEGIGKLIELCNTSKVRIEEADRVLSKISPKGNVYAAMVFRKFNDVLSHDKPHIVLHQLSDGGNIGTLLRSALGFGYRDIALIMPSADLFDPHGIRSSMGAAFALRIGSFTSFNDYERAYPNHELYPFMLRNAKPLEEVLTSRSTKEYALILGNEGKGLPDDFAQKGTGVKIMHSSEIDSLNVAIAGSIGMYAFSTQIARNTKEG